MLSRVVVGRGCQCAVGTRIAKNLELQARAGIQPQCTATGPVEVP
jgi:hypothetical protein